MKKMNEVSKEGVIEQYEEKQNEIRRLLKQIEAGLETHDRRASSKGAHHWGHVGDLNKIISDLTEVKDRLAGTGEFAKKAFL